MMVKDKIYTKMQRIRTGFERRRDEIEMCALEGLVFAGMGTGILLVLESVAKGDKVGVFQGGLIMLGEGLVGYWALNDYSNTKLYGNPDGI